MRDAALYRDSGRGRDPYLPPQYPPRDPLGPWPRDSRGGGGEAERWRMHDVLDVGRGGERWRMESPPRRHGYSDRRYY